MILRKFSIFLIKPEIFIIFLQTDYYLGSLLQSTINNMEQQNQKQQQKNYEQLRYDNNRLLREQEARRDMASKVNIIREHRSSITPLSIITEVIDNGLGPHSWGQGREMCIMADIRNKTLIIADNGVGMTPAELGDSLKEGHGKQLANFMNDNNNVDETYGNGVFGEGNFTSGIKCGDKTEVFSCKKNRPIMKSIMDIPKMIALNSMVPDGPLMCNQSEVDFFIKKMQNFFDDRFTGSGTLYRYTNVRPEVFSVLFPNDNTEYLEHCLNRVYHGVLQMGCTIQIRLGPTASPIVLNSGVNLVHWDEANEDSRLEQRFSVYQNPADNGVEIYYIEPETGLEYCYTEQNCVQMRGKKFKGCRIDPKHKATLQFVGDIVIKSTYPDRSITEKEVSFETDQGMLTESVHGLHIRRSGRLLNMSNAVVPKHYVGTGWMNQYFRHVVDYIASKFLDKLFKLDDVKRIDSATFVNLHPCLQCAMYYGFVVAQESLAANASNTREVRAEFLKYHIKQVFNQLMRMLPAKFRKLVNSDILSQYPERLPSLGDIPDDMQESDLSLMAKLDNFLENPDWQTMLKFVTNEIIDRKHFVENTYTLGKSNAKAFVIKNQKERGALKRLFGETLSGYFKNMEEDEASSSGSDDNDIAIVVPTTVSKKNREKRSRDDDIAEGVSSVNSGVKVRNIAEGVNSTKKVCLDAPAALAPPAPAMVPIDDEIFTDEESAVAMDDQDDQVLDQDEQVFDDQDLDQDDQDLEDDQDDQVFDDQVFDDDQEAVFVTEHSRLPPMTGQQCLDKWNYIMNNARAFKRHLDDYYGSAPDQIFAGETPFWRFFDETHGKFC